CEEGLPEPRLSMENWQPVAGAGAGGSDRNQRWVYCAVPHGYNAQVQEMAFTNDVFTFSFTSMAKRVSPRWDIGDPGLAESPVATWGPGKHFAFSITSVQPPEPACGAVEIGS